MPRIDQRRRHTLTGAFAALALALTLALTLVAWAGTAAAQQPTATASYRSNFDANETTAKKKTIRKEEELLILQLQLGSYVISDSFFGFLNGGSLIVPLGELARLLDFAISVDTGNARAAGWYIKENNLFSLDLAANMLIIKGERVKFDPAMIELHKNDIFVDVRQLAKWFPIDIQYDAANLMVVLTSREPLPIERKTARERQREIVINQREKQKAVTDATRKELPDQWLGWPLADVYTEFSYRNDSSGQAERKTRYNVLMSGDVAKLNAEVFLGGDNEDRLSQARIKFRRMDPDGGMFGPLKATEFQFGDIFTPQTSLVSNTQIGRGAVISNMPLDRPSEFDRITLDGDLPVGWEVELYRNEVLLDFRVDQSSGRYSFQNVPLLFGVNILRLVFYGPQGQVREEVKQLLVGPGQIKPGEHQFRMAFNQQDQQLLLSRVDTGITDTERQGKNRFFAEYQTGITRNLSVASNFSSIPFDGGHRSYLGVSGRAFLGPVFGRVDLVEDIGNGEAAQMSAQTTFGGVS
ncbi:MAG: hypothetical protein RIB59_16230, partial [Rhodospirillales bacterium]